MALSLRSGIAGAATVTALHQLSKYTLPRAPRMDTLGRRALARILKGADIKPPRGKKLQGSALLAEIVSNTLYYSFGGGWLRGALLGAAAGYGAVKLPPKVGLGWWQTRRTRDTKRKAFTLYLLGGLAAALAA